LKSKFKTKKQIVGANHFLHEKYYEAEIDSPLVQILNLVSLGTSQ